MELSMSETIKLLTSCYLFFPADSFSPEIVNLSEKLKTKIKEVHVFSNKTDCFSKIEQNNEEKILLIVSNNGGQEFISTVNNYPQFIMGFVFCINRDYAKQWTKPYPKMKGIFDDGKKLIYAIDKNEKNSQIDGEKRLNEEITNDDVNNQEIDEPMKISVIDGNIKIQEERDAASLWFQIFIEILTRMGSIDNDKKEMIDLCRKLETTEKELKNIDEFEREYNPDNAVNWYTRDTCFYRLMNRALRQHDYDTLFSFRIFIRDISLDIKRLHEESIRHKGNQEKFIVYRGQAIVSNELELIKSSIGQLLSMNSFLSTSRDRLVALKFSHRKKSENHQPIIFEITIDPKCKTKYFADIQSKSLFQYESEVLIMVGALFLINSVKMDESEKIWIIQVELADENDHRLKDLLKYMKDKIGDHTNLDTLGKHFLRMDDNRRAENCYKRLLHETKVTLADSLLGLGWSAMRLKDYDQSLVHFNKSIEIRQEIYGNNHEKVAECHSFIGEVFRMMNKFGDAQKHLESALEIQEKILEKNSVQIAPTYHSLGNLFLVQDLYQLALERLSRTLEIRQMTLPGTHPQIAFTYRDLGLLFSRQKDFQAAKEYYKKAYEISSKTLTKQHSLNQFLEDKLNETK